MKQQIPVDVPVTLFIQAVHGDLTIHGWTEPLLEWQCDDEQVAIHAQDTGLVLSPCQSYLTLKLPQSAEVHIATIYGDAHVTHLRRVSIDHISGDLTLRQITEQATIGVVNGNLTASAVAELTVTSDVQSDVTLTDVPVVRLTGVNGDLTGRGVLSLSLDQVAGDLELSGLSEQVQIRSVNGDVTLATTGTASISLERVNGDLTIRGQASSVRCLVVGGDIDTTEAAIDQLTVETIAGDVETGTLATGRITTIGGDLEIGNITRELTIGTVGGDCTIKQATGTVTLNTIGGDLLWLQATITAQTTLQAHVAGDATIVLPESPDVTVTAVVGGEISGIEGHPSLSGQTVELRYGNGTASIHLHVGGDLTIKGADHPGSFSSISAQLGKELSELGRELGRELSELGRELASELRRALSGSDPDAAKRARDVAERFSEHAQRWRDTSGSERVRVRINQREWRLDPERIERIKDQARQAAATGLSSALEAVERALSRIQPPQPPTAPQPPQPPAAPQPPQPPAPPPPATGQTIQLRNAASQTPLNDAEREQQRASILQMVAEGRISPAEGDLLLAALDDTGA